MKIKYFDIHSHLDYPDYKSDFSEIIDRMEKLNIGTITIGTDLNSSRSAVELSNKYQNVWACVGIHPADNHLEEWNESEFEKLIENPKIVAIGECGLDFFRLSEKDEEAEIQINRQEELFRKQIEFAIKYQKVLMIHCREAYEDVYGILAEYKIGDLADKNFGNFLGNSLKIHLHFFAGDLEIAKKFLELDATFSFTGVITFARNYDKVIKFLPLEKIMSETDAPFVAPVPYRGKRNEPSFVTEVIKKIAEIRNGDSDKISEQILENVKEVFGIKF